MAASATNKWGRTWRRAFRRRAPPERPRARFAAEKFLQICAHAGRTGRCLDVGCGDGEHVRFLTSAEVFSRVEGLDIIDQAPSDFPFHRTAIEEFSSPEPYDAIWCSHVLEHTRNVGLFLLRIRTLLADGGILCLVVPPVRPLITVGHVTVWSGGLLLLNLVRNGFDCSNAILRRQGYNIALIVEKRSCPARQDFGLDPATSYRPFLPQGLTWSLGKNGVWYFDGEIEELNWRRVKRA